MPVEISPLMFIYSLRNGIDNTLRSISALQDWYIIYGVVVAFKADIRVINAWISCLTVHISDRIHNCVLYIAQHHMYEHRQHLAFWLMALLSYTPPKSFIHQVSSI